MCILIPWRSVAKIIILYISFGRMYHTNTTATAGRRFAEIDTVALEDAIRDSGGISTW